MKRGGLKLLIGAFLDCIFPRRCVSCEFFDSFLCNRCTGQLGTLFAMQPISSDVYNTKLIYQAWSFFKDHELIVTLIHAIKYEYITEIAQIFEQVIKISQETFNEYDAIIPIPLHRRRFCERGFNQAQLFADIISQQSEIPVENKLLLRVKNTKKQAHLDEHERQENILGAFKINLKIKIPKRVLLIDDVMTTGSTLHEAAQTLQQAGVEVISIICLMYRARRV